MNTHETYVSFETAKLLKEARFDWECNYAYTFSDNEVTNKAFLSNWSDTFIDAPTLTVAQKWLREVKGYSIYPTYGGYKIYVLDTNDSADFSRTYELNGNLTYEESQEAGEKKALELILEKGE